MFVRMACPSCGVNDEVEVEPRGGAVECPSCGAPLAAMLVVVPAGRARSSAGPDEDVADWLDPRPRAPEPAAETAERTCRGCGYTGPMVLEPGLEEQICPACGRTDRSPAAPAGRLPRAEQDRRFFETPPPIRLPEPPTRLPCPECGHALSAQRGKTVVCPSCNSFLGCLVPDEKGSTKWWRR